MQMTSITDKIWEISAFLTPQTCEQLILQGEHAGFKEADVGLPGGSAFMKNIRDNYRAIYQDEAFTAELSDRLLPFLPQLADGQMPAGLHTPLRFYRYDGGQKFKRHIDGRVTEGDLQSRLTFMVYLNDDFKGGETKFDEVSICPERGKALLFIHEQKHESLPILSGTKYVLRSDVLYSAGSTSR